MKLLSVTITLAERNDSSLSSMMVDVSAHVELCGLVMFLWTGMLSSGPCVSFGMRRVLSLAEEELKSLSVSADAFLFHCTCNLFFSHFAFREGTHCSAD